MSMSNYKHRKVVDLYIRGYTVTEAYRAVYPKASTPTCNINGNKIIKEQGAAKYISERILEAKNHATWDQGDVLRRIMSIIESDDSTNADRLKALKLGAEIKGYIGKARNNQNNTQTEEVEESDEQLEEEFNNMSDEELAKLLRQLQ